MKDPKAELREFGISTTTELRDALDQGLVINEQTGPRVVSGDVAFDALFALTMKELDQLAVSEIKDGNYNYNNPIKAEVLRRARSGITCGRVIWRTQQTFRLH